MFTFVAKPVEVEAWQYFKDVGTNTACIPSWAISLAVSRLLRPSTADSSIDVLSTPMGVVNLESGDWIVRDNKEYWVFTNEEFTARYQPKV